MAVLVAHIVFSFDTGGLQNGIVNVVNGSDPDLVRHVVVSMTDSIGAAKRLERGDVVSVGLPPGRRVRAHGPISETLRRLRPDIVHTRNWSAWQDGVRAARRARVPRVIHGYHGRDLSNVGGERLRRRILGRALACLSDRLVTLTPAMAREFSRDFFVPLSRLTVIPNGVDVGRFTAAAKERTEASPFTVLSVGRLDPVKNFTLLVRAFRDMPGRTPEHRLLIAGEGPERARIEEEIWHLGLQGSAQVLGERGDVAALYASADVYVQPSHYEGMSNTLVEAMASGLPVLATAVGGNPDVLGPDLSECLFPSGDAAALASALSSLLASPDRRRDLGRRARRWVEAEFRLERMIAAYTGLYEATAERSEKER